jgi:hypothetical protein
MKKLIYSLLMLIVLGGCVSLKEVREFAGESAKLSAYTELTTRFRDTYEREQPYLFGEAERLAKENDEKRKAIYKDLISIHESVSLYMQTLAKLAGDETFDLSKGIDSLAGGIKAYPNWGIEDKHVDAYSKVTKTIAKWALSGYQQHAVRELLKEGDDPLRTLLDGMTKIILLYRKTYENEKKSVLGLFETEIAFMDSPKDKMLSSLARAHAQSKEAEYKLADAKYAAAEKGVKAIAEGHRRLLENIEKLSSKEAKDLIKQVTKDVKAVRAELQSLRT